MRTVPIPVLYKNLKSLSIIGFVVWDADYVNADPQNINADSHHVNADPYLEFIFNYSDLYLKSLNNSINTSKLFKKQFIILLGYQNYP